MIAAVAACSPEQAGPTNSASDVAQVVSGSLDSALPDGNELSIRSDVGVREPLRRAVESSLKTALEPAHVCMDGIYGSVFAEVEFGTAGKVTHAHIRSPLLEDSPIAKCLEKELASMSIGKVDAAVYVTY